jgi:SAM-dependent methyltransferase
VSAAATLEQAEGACVAVEGCRVSFPYHDPFWCDAASFVERYAERTHAILAPDIFWWRFPKIYRYVNTKIRPSFRYDWIILHKGLLEELPRAFVARSLKDLQPAFANEVFVVLSRWSPAPLQQDNPHFLALTQQLERLPEDKDEPPSLAAEPVLPEPGAIYKFSALDDREFKEAMDEFWLNGGYVYSTCRDKTYYEEIDRCIAEFIVGKVSQGSVLDLACGIGRLGEIFPAGSHVIGVDVSSVAIDRARERHKAFRNFSFAQMDAHDLRFADESFDAVLFIDAIEHVKDAGGVLAEIARVLRPGGILLLTVANRDSVNQVLTRKLGYPEFVTNYQHIREFSYAETLSMLDANQLQTKKTRGIFLYPYWGVPGVDEIVREVTDEDPEFVELMRKLGEKVGAEHAYCSVVLARKTRETGRG